jgi:hypothetical protein
MFSDFFKEFWFVAKVAIIHWKMWKSDVHPLEDLAKNGYKSDIKYI